MDIVVVRDRLNEMKKILHKAIEGGKLDKTITFSLLEKQAALIEDLLKMFEEVDDRFELLEGKFVEK
jgi:hypothetical protein